MHPKIIAIFFSKVSPRKSKYIIRITQTKYIVNKNNICYTISVTIQPLKTKNIH